MHPTFDEYGKTVCRHVRHATGREKASIRAELTAHMEDHAQALLDGAFEEEHAYRVAVKAMGDPEEVGKALNREYPLRWLILSRVLWLGILLFALLILSVLFNGLRGVPGSLEARYHPMASHAQEITLPDVELTPVDIRQSLPNGDVFYVYASAVEYDERYGYIGHIFAVTYNENPLRTPLYTYWDLEYLTSTPKEQMLVNGEAGARGNALYIHQELYTVQPIEAVTIQYDRYGAAFTIELPLPWEEVLDP